MPTNSFQERDGESALSAVLAIGAFGEEQPAAGGYSGSGSGHWEIEMTGTPRAIQVGSAPQLTLLSPHPEVTIAKGTYPTVHPAMPLGFITLTPFGPGLSWTVTGAFPTLPYMIELKETLGPSAFVQSLCSDGVWRYLSNKEIGNYEAMFDVSTAPIPPPPTSVWSAKGTGTASFQVELLGGGPGLIASNSGMVFRTGGGTFTAPVTFTLSMTIGTTMAAPFVITGAMTYYPVWELYVTPAGTSFIGTALLLAGYPTLTLPPIIATLPPPFPPFLDLEDLIMGYIAANGDPWDMYNLPGRRAAVGPAQDTAIFQYNSFWLND